MRIDGANRGFQVKLREGAGRGKLSGGSEETTLHSAGK
jgi:hypothetical protein